MEKQNGQPIKGFWESLSFNLLLKSIKFFANLVENEQELEVYADFARSSSKEIEQIDQLGKWFGKEYKPGQRDEVQIADILDHYVKLFKKGFVIYGGALYSVKERKSIPDTSGLKKIEAKAFLNDRSDYFILETENGQAIFNKTGKRVTDWFDHVHLYGLVRGESDYYAVSKQGELYIGKLGIPKLFGPFKEVKDVGFFRLPAQSTVTFETLDGQQATFTKQEVEEFFEEKELEDER